MSSLVNTLEHAGLVLSGVVFVTLYLKWRKHNANAVDTLQAQTILDQARQQAETILQDARLAASADPEGDLAALSAVNPLKRLGTEAEVAALAAHLLGSESGWTTGCVIPIDGGADAVY